MTHYSRHINYNGFAVDNVTDMDGVHHTQPTNRRAELWAAYHEIQRKSAEWFKGVGTQNLPVGAINNYHELKLIQDETGV